jgi:hypothetical protein
MNIQAMKEAAQIAAIGEWYNPDELQELLLDTGSAAHIANCDPGTILKLLAVVEAARQFAYTERSAETRFGLTAALKELE